MENLSWYKPVIYLGMVSMAFINLATSSLGMINPIETFTSVYNLYLKVSFQVVNGPPVLFYASASQY